MLWLKYVAFRIERTKNVSLKYKEAPCIETSDKIQNIFYSKDSVWNADSEYISHMTVSCVLLEILSKTLSLFWILRNYELITYEN